MSMADIDLKGQAGKLREKKTNGQDRFILSDPEWQSVQAYCAAVQALPITEAEIKLKFALTKNQKVSDFEPLRAQYESMYKQVQKWDLHTMPKSITLATHVDNYGRNAKIYYGEMLRLAEEGLSKGNNKKEFLEIVEDRAKKAKEFATEAKDVAKDIGEFENGVKSSIDKMTSLKKTYDDKYGSSSQKWKDINDKIKKLQDDLKKANEEYEHDCIVAGTTPTYAWVTILGFIAAVTVASVYGKKAVEMKETIKQIEKEIGDAEGDLTAYSHIQASTKCAADSITSVQTKAGTAAQALGRMRSGWEKIATSLDDIAKLVDKDIRQAESLVKLQVKQAIADWEAVAKDANGYIQNAYIKKPSPVELMMAA